MSTRSRNPPGTPVDLSRTTALVRVRRLGLTCAVRPEARHGCTSLAELQGGGETVSRSRTISGLDRAKGGPS